MITDDEVAAATVEIVESAAASTERSPADLVRLAVAAAVAASTMALEWLTGDSIPRYVADVLRGFDVLPEWLLHVVFGLVRLAAAALLVAGLVAVVRNRRWRILLTVAAAAAVAAGLTALTKALAPDAGPSVTELGFTSDFPTSLGLAAASATVAAAAPWLARRWRRIGWASVLALAVAQFISNPISFEAERAFLLGWLVGAISVVVLGGPNRRPRGAAIAAGLARVGSPLSRLEQASLDARGSTPYFAVAADGRRLFVKALGEDERSADLLFRSYRAILPRDLGDERPFSSLRRAVEHEALVALWASSLGVRTPAVAAVATAEPHGFVLAYEAIDGRSLDRLEPSGVTDDLLRAIWTQVDELRSHRIAHRDLRLANIFVAADGAVWMIDFGFSELAASDLLLANDVAELLASSSLQVGAERAVGNAAAVVAPETLRAGLPRLHPWALSGATRTALKERPALLPDVRERVAQAAAGGDGPR
ncbi:MAG: hypothetical protein ACRD0A_01985 [Acidimicrobiales bacterium]